MTNPLFLLIRAIILHRRKSTVATQFIPLEKIKEAVVLVDSSMPDVDKVTKTAEAFFSGEKIKYLILNTKDSNINLLGYIKKKVRLQDPSRAEDLFISLVANPKCFAAEYEAKCSKAGFKIGRCLYKKDIFDLRYSDTEQKQSTQAEVLSDIFTFLKKIV